MDTLRRWTSGDKPSAAHLNEVVDRLNKQGDLTGAGGTNVSGIPGGTIIRSKTYNQNVQLLKGIIVAPNEGEDDFTDNQYYCVEAYTATNLPVTWGEGTNRFVVTNLAENWDGHGLPYGTNIDVYSQNIQDIGIVYWTITAPPLPLYYLVDCFDVEDDMRVTNDFHEEVVGEWVIKYQDTCWTVRLPTDDERLECYEPNCISGYEVYWSCPKCANCWKLTPCTTGTTLYTYTNLTAYDGKAVLIGSLWYTVSSSSTGCSAAAPVTVITSAPNCDSIKCYTVRMCGTATTKVLNNNFSSVAGVVGRVFKYYGICWEVINDTGDCEGAENWLGITWEASCAACGCIALTECGSSTPSLWRKSLKNGAGAYIDMNAEVGKVLRLDDGKCYTWAFSTTCTNPAEDDVVLEAYATCDDCVITTLTKCGTATTMTTYTDMSNYAVGDVVRVSSECWEVTNKTGVFAGSAALGNITASYLKKDDATPCTTCAGFGTIKYILTNGTTCRTGCTGSARTPIVTLTDLSASVGKAISYQGACWTVSVGTTETVTETAIGTYIKFADCSKCSETKTSGKVKFIKNIRISGTDIVADVESMIIENGLIVAFCTETPITLEGRDCTS